MSRIRPKNEDQRGLFVSGPSSRQALDDRRSQIVRSAAALFIENGYARTSMAAVSAHVGGSKGTLYNYFRSKEELFAAVTEFSAPALHWLDGVLSISGAPIEEILLEVGRAFYKAFATPNALALFRVVLAEGPHFPEIREIFWKKYVDTTFKRFEDYLAEATKRGVVNINDPARAARYYFTLIRGELYLRMVAGVIDAPSQKEIDDFLEDSVGLFVTLFVDSIINS